MGDLGANERNNVTLACQSCGHRVRLPIDWATVTLRCPSCNNEAEWTTEATRPLTPKHALAQPFRPTTADAIDVLFHCAQDGNSFSVTFGRPSPNEKYQIRSINPSRRFHNIGIGASTSDSFDPKSLDFAGWHCACCGFRGPWPASVKCGTCNRLVCGCRVISIQGGRQTFQCAPDCGSSGVLEGEIASFDGRRTVADQVSADNQRVSLPNTAIADR